MSMSDPIAPERLEALLRGEAGSDGRERRIGALLDELTMGEIAPPAELRERVRSLRSEPVEAPPASRRFPRLQLSLRRPRWRLAPALGLAATIGRGRRRCGDADAGPPHRPPLPPRSARRTTALHLKAHVQGKVMDRAFAATGESAPSLTAPPAKTSATAPLPDGQRAQDYAASLRLAVGTVAELSRSTQTVLDTVRSLGGAVETLQYGTPSAGTGSALIDLRVPVGRAQEALRRFSALGTITAQQVQIRDLQAGLDRETNRARALRHRVELLKAKLLSPSLTAEARVTLEGRLADAQTALESVLRGVHGIQQRAAFARFSLELDTGRGTAIAPRRSPARSRTPWTTPSASSRSSAAAPSSPSSCRTVRPLRRRRVLALAPAQAPGCEAAARELVTRRATASRQAPKAVPAPTPSTHASASHQTTGAASLRPMQPAPHTPLVPPVSSQMPVAARGTQPAIVSRSARRGPTQRKNVRLKTTGKATAAGARASEPMSVSCSPRGLQASPFG